MTSLAWSPDSTRLFSASDRFARVFDGKSGQLLHRFEHDRVLWSIALSPKHNALACVGNDGVANFWDTEYRQQPGQPFHREHKTLRCVSFSRDGRYVAYGGDDSKLTLWMLKDIAPQIPAPTLLQESDRRSTQQKTRPDSPLSSCLNADATGGDDLIEEVHDLYSDFFQSSQKSLPLPSSGSRLTPLSSTRRLLNFFSRCCPPEDESVPQERFKRGFFSRRARLNASLEPAPTTPNQPVPEVKVGEGERGDNVSTVSTLACFHVNVTTISAVLGMICLTTERIKAKREMMVLLPTRRAYRPMIPTPLLSLTALAIETFGQSSCADKERILHLSK